MKATHVLIGVGVLGGGIVAWRLWSARKLRAREIVRAEMQPTAPPLSEELGEAGIEEPELELASEAIAPRTVIASKAGAPKVDGRYTAELPDEGPGHEYMRALRV